MDDQLATSSCLVGSLERFIDITENQNSDSTVLTDVVVMSGVSEKKSGVKRRSNNAKQRLSQINQENVGLIEKRVLHRENSAKKIQKLWRDARLCLLSKRALRLHSKNTIRNFILSRMMQQLYAKKRNAVEVLQRWWLQELRRQKRIQRYNFTQQEKWSLNQADKVKAIIQGYRVRRVLSNHCKQPIRTAVMLLINANEVLEGICDDINTDPLVLNHILSVDSRRAMTRGLLIYCCLHRHDDPRRQNEFQKKKVDSKLLEDYGIFRKYLSQLAVKWDFIENFVYQILNNRLVVSNFFSQMRENKKIEGDISNEKRPPIIVHSPLAKENHKHFSNTKRVHLSTTRHSNKGKKASSEAGVNKRVNYRDYVEGDKNGGKSLAPQSLMSLIHKKSPECSVKLEQYCNSLSKEEHGTMNSPQSSVETLKRSPNQPSRISMQNSSPTPNESSSFVDISGGGCSTSLSIPAQSVPVSRPQYSNKPHLQIDVIRAQCLGRVSAARKSRNQVPRKPSIKVTVCLPTCALSEEVVNDSDVARRSSLKSVHCATYVSPNDVSPTDPVWNFTTYCALRLPVPAPGSGVGGEVDYNKIMSNYWSFGTVKIEIIDSERFNEDIHMGEVTLFLSNFLLQGDTASASSTAGAISGNFSITTDGVNNSTTAQLAAAVYLHLPHSTFTRAKKAESIQRIRRPTYPPYHQKMSQVEANLSGVTKNLPNHERSIQSRDVKSTLAHMPSASFGGLTASARRQQRLQTSTAPEGNDSSPPNESVAKEEVLVSKGTEGFLTPPRQPIEHRSGSRDSGLRRKSLENMGNILDFLEDALQEEAEATVESLKQNYATSQTKERRRSFGSSPVQSPTLPTKSHSFDGYVCKDGKDINMTLVQNDLDDILGALSRSRILAKSRPHCENNKEVES